MPAEDELVEPDDAVQRAVLERFAAAIEADALRWPNCCGRTSSGRCRRS